MSVMQTEALLGMIAAFAWAAALPAHANIIHTGDTDPDDPTNVNSDTNLKIGFGGGGVGGRRTRRNPLIKE